VRDSWPHTDCGTECNTWDAKTTAEGSGKTNRPNKQAAQRNGAKGSGGGSGRFSPPRTRGTVYGTHGHRNLQGEIQCARMLEQSTKAPVDASDRRATPACCPWNQTSVGTLHVDTPEASRSRFPVKREHTGRHRSAHRSLECQWGAAEESGRRAGAGVTQMTSEGPMAEAEGVGAWGDGQLGVIKQSSQRQ